MEPPGLPPGTGGPLSGGATWRLTIVLAGVLAAAGAAEAVAILRFGSTTSGPFLVTVAGLLVGLVAGLTNSLLSRSPAEAARHPARRTAGGARAWVAGRGWVEERDADDRYLAQEIAWSFRKAAERAGLDRLVFAPGGYWETVPIVQRVQLRPFTRLTVQLRPGQTVKDIVAIQDRLRELMRAKEIYIEHLAAEFVNIELRGGSHGPRLSIHDVT